MFRHLFCTWLEWRKPSPGCTIDAAFLGRAHAHVVLGQSRRFSGILYGLAPLYLHPDGGIDNTPKGPWRRTPPLKHHTRVGHLPSFCQPDFAV
ncbi:hypothetical protein N658DRAFT_83578 [Parathielavia hyrcaniae]|uniref:Uncharacterized protein n=1 Tax=Parathielavia hyrcaniae TaxID=113614 RepID=A0AAN6PZP7_9PEZI|nr:hypothetical protein N658DRAFT_83578 [Parathielavia hyrcaniae]